MKKIILTTILAALAVVGCTGPDVEPDTTSVLGSTLAKVKLLQLDGESFAEAKLSKAPEFYVLYYSASW